MAAGNDSYCHVFNVGITEGVPRADAPGPTDPELVNIELKVKFIDMETYGCPEDGVFAERGRKHSQVIHYYDPEYLINNTNGVVLEILNYQRVPLEPTVIDAIADCAVRLALATRDGVNSTMLKVEIDALAVNGFPGRVNNGHVEVEDDDETTEAVVDEFAGGVISDTDADYDDDDDEDWQKMLEEEAAEEYLETEVVVESGEICSICLGELAVGSEAACMPCSHMFHHSCILPWLTKVQSCPYCRFDLNNEL
ncbi:Zinc finger, RING-type [Corchorus capsularis]|uniref:RING-type E3 ubiquitin transferase n=1 Tax=Corchorus capsularis TaxID=210143 RepID=A0A1R3I2P6_COCAP|nr:Zinc finger, RING-type [Corchorus capsularis]